MKKETMETEIKVLEIAIHYGYNGSIENNFIEIITSRKFIDAFAKYLWDKSIKNESFTQEYVSNDFIKSFRHKLADSIYNNTLESLFLELI